MLAAPPTSLPTRFPPGVQAWRQGRTGYPLVDAGMRELWSTGWFHNRIRVVCASFLVKHLLLPWQVGGASGRARGWSRVCLPACKHAGLLAHSLHGRVFVGWGEVG